MHCQKLSNTTSSKLQIGWGFCTHQQRQIRVDILPTLLPSSYHPYYLSFNPHLFFYFYSFFIYKSELVALEKWVWKFETSHHYVVKFLVLF